MALFVTIEGPEGSGKTTIANKVLDTLKKEGYKFKTEWESSKNRYGEKTDSFLLFGRWRIS